MRLNGTRLTGPQVDEFRQAIRDAFNNEQKFKEFLFTQLNRQLDDITAKEVFPTEIYNVITAAEDEDWTEELLRAARLWRPTNTKLLLFAQQFGLALKTPSEPELKSTFERMVRPNNKVIDVALWREKLAQIEGQICRVEVRDGGETSFGTGFLLGPDVIMTNYHVVQHVIKGDISTKNVSFLFDFKKTTNTPLPGIPYYLAEKDWYIDYSEYSSLDEVRNSWDRPCDEDKLDYALMRLSAQAGEERIGGEANKNPHASVRGWIEVPTIERELRSGSELFIMQHKDGDQLTLALDTNSITQTNTNNTRVFYKTNTDEGSSGAPCFDIDWQLVALHQGGDTHYQPKYNQGIPFSAITKLLTKRGKLSLLGITQKKELSSQHSSTSNGTQEPANMEAYREKQESNEPSPYEQTCIYFRDASLCLQKACKPLKEELYIPPHVFRNSSQYMQEVQVNIQKIIECLQTTPSLPTSVAKEQLGIIHELRMVDVNITRHLLPLLFQNKSGNFDLVLSLMHTIKEKLLPATIVPLQGMQQIENIQLATSASGGQKEGVAVGSQPSRTGIFISYSPKDKRSLDELRTHLSQYIHSGLVNAWDNTMILPGAKWHDEINKAIQSAKVAILLVSADFLASEFIVKNELSPVLKAAEHEGTTILCIILRPCAFNDTDLAQYQAVNAPSNPLSNMSVGKRDAIWEQVSTRVKDILLDK